MYLSKEHEKAVSGEMGPAIQWALERLCKSGDVQKAERLVKVRSVHIPGWCEERSSEIWSFLGSIRGKAEMPITANPGGEDDPTALSRKSLLESLRPHCAYTCSCAPYLSGNHPTSGVVAWGGRAACAFANSVLGARSEMETFETSVASAIAGVVPERGLHLDENRRVTVAVVVKGIGEADLPSIGREIARTMPGEVPLICGIRPNFDEAKKLALAVNADGKVPLFRMQGHSKPPFGVEAVELDLSTFQGREAKEAPADLAILGCPHLSEQEINHWSKRLSGRATSKAEVWFFTSRLCLDKCPLSGAVLRSRGKVFVDRCPLSMRRELDGLKVVCDSPSLADRLRRCGVDARSVSHQALVRHVMAEG